LPDDLAKAAHDLFLRRLAVENRITSAHLLGSYRSLTGSLRSSFDALTALSEKRNLTVSELARSKQLERLLAKTEKELDNFSEIIAKQSEIVQDKAIEEGADFASTELKLVGVRFNHPDIRAIQISVDYTDTSAFKGIIENFGGYHVQSAKDIIATAMTEGINPVQTARRIVAYYDKMPMYDAVRLTRTLQLWSARKSTHETYRQNAEYLDGWIWVASIPGACMSCVSQHGTNHPLDEELNDHHNGRCTPIPNTGRQKVQSGEDWFNSLSDTEQSAMMGAGKFEAWQEGKFNFSDLSKTYTNPLFGDMRRESTLAELVN